MNDQSRSDASRQVAPNPLVQRVAGRKPAREGLSTAVGWVGESDTSEKVRIYRDLELSAYCDIATSDIVDSEPVDTSDERSPVIIWIRQGAQVEFVRVVRLTAEQAFTQGPISRRHFSRARGLSISPVDLEVQAADGTVLYGCPIPTLEGACETRNIFCPTSPAQCGGSFGQSCSIIYC